MNTNMTQDEQKLRQMTKSKDGRTPFLVPEGYFDTLPSKMMQRIKEEGDTTQTRRRPRSRFFIRLTAAAVLTGFFSLAGLMMYEQSHPLLSNNEKGKTMVTQEIEYTDEVLDYAMLDNSDIEYYLTVAE